jgi:hypothetical protein
MKIYVIIFVYGINFRLFLIKMVLLLYWTLQQVDMEVLAFSSQILVKSNGSCFYTGGVNAVNKGVICLCWFRNVTRTLTESKVWFCLLTCFCLSISLLMDYILLPECIIHQVVSVIVKLMLNSNQSIDIDTQQIQLWHFHFIYPIYTWQLQKIIMRRDHPENIVL